LDWFQVIQIVKMIKSILQLLSLASKEKHSSDIIDIALGKNKYPETFSELIKQMRKDKWQK